MNFRGGPGRNTLGGGSFESNSHAANGLSFEEAMEAARFADLGGIITADDYETSSVSCLLTVADFTRGLKSTSDVKNYTSENFN